MDLNKTAAHYSQSGDLTKDDNLGDTTLSLNCFGFGGRKSSRCEVGLSDLNFNFSYAPDDGCRLVLGLGPTPSANCDDYYNVGYKNKSLVTSLPEEISSSDSILQLGLSGGTNEASSVVECLVSAETDVSASYLMNQWAAEANQMSIPLVDEGSTSAKKSGGYMPSLLFAPRMDTSKVLVQQELHETATGNKLSQEVSPAVEYSLETIIDQATKCLYSDHQPSNPKRCKYMGCGKGARGASGLCIGHGGGHRCQKPGCNKGAESRTAYCKAHGGGRRCQYLGCTKSAEGKTDFCIAHGGGRRCGYPGGCVKAARGKSGLCIRHGGGKRCKMEGCTRSAEGQAGLCISHGGGRRCQHERCTKGAQGSTMYCKAHGGGKRCIFAGCTKGAEGSTPLCKGHGGGKRCLFDGGGICPKSVHGGTNFCVAHGGGKRCTVPGCTKSARGRTDCCVRHGGGKRCKFDNCGKSAQGSTDFCKAHGGGKRCSWGGEGKCEKFARGKSGLCAAHSSMIQDRETNKGSLIGPGLFHGLVSASACTGGSSSLDNHNSSSGISFICDSTDSAPKRHRLIPPQVLVPSSMKSSSSYSSFVSREMVEEDEDGNNGGYGNGGIKSLEYSIPEGRVHGGGLMSLLGGHLKNNNK
ncbi:uncharacterized protein LOC111021804 [Momordica charantia]|uniref:Uncharacterized protein LOC111021804 n=1 Tax=Momordica charantia TaxID=3673 RepID=A0A6J1DP40_MOMCH|nr:uncharacterized protein LOC111021804 [Momordica charantia]XP_022154566.1 uncharacterized protein LOC111021804 [Momordica charantia]